MFANVQTRRFIEPNADYNFILFCSCTCTQFYTKALSVKKMLGIRKAQQNEKNNINKAFKLVHVYNSLSMSSLALIRLLALTIR